MGDAVRITIDVSAAQWDLGEGGRLTESLGGRPVPGAALGVESGFDRGHSG